MRLTKLGHACVRLEKDGATLVIDPGGFTDAAAALAGAAAVLVTHEHPDHLDDVAIRAAMTAGQELTLWANHSVCGLFPEFGDRVHEVGHGDAVSVSGFDVHVYGERHAVVHPDIPVLANSGFLVDGTVFHPGDALTIPEDPVPVLLVPVSAPWLKLSEMIDYYRAVAPARGFAIHDAILNENGIGLISRLMPIAGPGLSRLQPGTSADL